MSGSTLCSVVVVDDIVIVSGITVIVATVVSLVVGEVLHGERGAERRSKLCLGNGYVMVSLYVLTDSFSNGYTRFVECCGEVWRRTGDCG